MTKTQPPVLGIDASKTCTAFAWRIGKTWTTVENKGTEFIWLRQIVGQAYREGCRTAILEDGYLGRNAKTAKVLDQLRGRIQEMCEVQGFEVHLVAPMTWKSDMLKVNGELPKKSVDQKAASIFSATVMGADLAKGNGSISDDKADAVNMSEWGRLNYS